MLGIMNTVIRTATLSEETRHRAPRSSREEARRSEGRARRALRLTGLK